MILFPQIRMPRVVESGDNDEYGLLGGMLPPPVGSGSGGPQTVGIRFKSNQNGFVSGVRFYAPLGGNGTIFSGRLYLSETSALLDEVNNTSAYAASDIVDYVFPSPIPINPGVYYTASVYLNGYYWGSSFTTRIVGSLTANYADGGYPNNGLYIAGSGCPSYNWAGLHFGVDVIYYE